MLLFSDCDHLTDFATRFEAFPEEQYKVFAVSTRVFTLESLTNVPDVFIIVGVTLGIFLALLFLSVLFDARDSVRVFG